MKVTALIPDELIRQIQKQAHGKNLTESLLIVLQQWLAHQKIKKLNDEIAQKPLEFKSGFSAESVRQLNRRR